jgi:mannosyltransferase
MSARFAGFVMPITIERPRRRPGRLAPPALSGSLGVFTVAAGLFVALRLWRLTTYSLRPDEIFSLETARLGWWDLLVRAARDIVHPPLFYALLKVWIAIGGESEAWLRLLPVVTAIASVVPFAGLCRELRLGPAATNLALLLMAVNGYLIYYAQELRMYSLLVLATLTSLWTLARWLRAPLGDRTPLVALVAANVLLTYTHYYGWLVVAVELGFVLGWSRHRLARFALSIVPAVVCFAPWAFVTGRLVARRGLEANIGSFPRPRLVEDVGGYYARLSGPLGPGWATALGLLVFVMPVVWWAWRVRRSAGPEDRREARTFWLLALVAFAPVVFLYAVSHALPQSIWGSRLLIFTAPAVIMLAAGAVSRLRPARVRAVVVTVLVVWACLAGGRELKASGKHAWAPLVAHMSRAEGAGSAGIPVYSFDSSDETIAYYLRQRGDGRFRTRRVKQESQMEGEYFWVAVTGSRRRAVPRWLGDRGYEVGESVSDGFGATLFPACRRSMTSRSTTPGDRCG